MTGIIDRFEGIYCIVEMDDKSIKEFLIDRIPLGAKEGDIIIINDSDISIDLSETSKRKRRIEEKAKDLWDWSLNSHLFV